MQSLKKYAIIITAEASAAVVSGDVDAKFQILGFGVSVGLDGSVLSAGAKASAGLFDDDEGMGLGAEAEAKAGLYGLGLEAEILLPF